MDRIILASQSPRRRQLLEWACLDFDVMISDSEENFPPGLPVEEVPIFIARNKALAVQQKLPGEAIIIAADTIVVLNQQIIGKPENRKEAINILQALSGKKHDVITGVVMKKGAEEISFQDKTSVWFHQLTVPQIHFYVDKFKPFDKAGAYAIQEWIGVIGISRIEGDFYNVMGLPVSRMMKEIQPWLKEKIG
jgi:septum formation protein